MESNKQLQTFISYSRINQQFAIKLACELKSAGFSVWMDQFDIPTGARWDEEIEKALRACQIFMFIMTPDSIASENAKDEVGYAIDHDKRIMPVLLEECEVPLRLHRLQYVDFTQLSFNEGINSAKKLLAKLIDEIETSASEAEDVVGTEVQLKGALGVLNEPKTVPPKSMMPSQPTQPELRRQGKLAQGLKIAGIGVITTGLLAVAALILKPLLFTPPLPSPTPTSIPPRIAPPTTDLITPTDNPAPPTTEILRSFTEEFSSNSQWDSDWALQFRDGDLKEKNNFNYAITDGNLIFDLTYKNVWGYFLYKPTVLYDDVEVEIVASGLRSTHTLGLICGFGDQGWYEFDINGGGQYVVRYVDHMESDRDEGQYVIHFGYIPGFQDSYAVTRENSIRAGCDHNNLSLFVNDTELMRDVPSKYDLGQGQVGIAIRSFENYPIRVVLKSISVRAP